MGAITVGNVKVAPFVFENLQELRIEKNINEHATLYVRGIVKDSWKNLPVTDAAVNTNIKCEDAVNVYFSGVLQSVAVTCEDDVYFLEAWAVSHTVNMNISSDLNLIEMGGASIKLDNVVHSINMETESGIKIDSKTNLNMAAVLNASLTGDQKLDLTSNIIVNAASTNLSHAGKTSLTEMGGLGLVNLSPIGALVAGPLIFED